MKPGSIAVVGAAETTELGKLPNMSNIQLHADAALNAMADCGLKPEDIDGVATARENPTEIAYYLGIKPKWVDGTSVGGCSFMIHVRHAAAAISAGLCKTALITHGESGRSQIGMTPRSVGAGMLEGQFQLPYGTMNPPTMFTIPVLRYMKTYDVPVEKIANVAVVQREWAAMHPRASFRDPITVDDVLESRMIAYPFRLLMCCLVTDGGGALILTSADRAKDFPTKPVYILGTGESVETTLISQMADFTSSQAFRIAGSSAFASAGIKHSDVDHLMIYDAFAHLPIYRLEDLGFVGLHVPPIVFGKTLDHPDLRPLFREAEALDVPIGIHQHMAVARDIDQGRGAGVTVSRAGQRQVEETGPARRIQPPLLLPLRALPPLPARHGRSPDLHHDRLLLAP